MASVFINFSFAFNKEPRSPNVLTLIKSLSDDFVSAFSTPQLYKFSNSSWFEKTILIFFSSNFKKSSLCLFTQKGSDKLRANSKLNSFCFSARF